MVATASRTREMTTTTIRVSVAARDRLQAIAQEEQKTLGEVVDALLEADRRRRFWEEMRIAVEHTKADPVAWAEYQAEFRLWDTASADGLPVDEDWTGMWDEGE